jgi:hypothetical protein
MSYLPSDLLVSGLFKRYAELIFGVWRLSPDRLAPKRGQNSFTDRFSYGLSFQANRYMGKQLLNK